MEGSPTTQPPTAYLLRWRRSWPTLIAPLQSRLYYPPGGVSPSTTAHEELAVVSHGERLVQLCSIRRRVASQPEALSALLAERIDALDQELGLNRPQRGNAAAPQFRCARAELSRPPNVSAPIFSEHEVLWRDRSRLLRSATRRALLAASF